jgi:hypothetical protein
MASVARCWTPALQALGVERAASVLDLCPGFAPKLELALHYAGCEGRVLLVDKERATLDELLTLISAFGVRFSAEPRVLDVERERPPRAPFIAANHVLDDIAMNRGASLLGVALRAVYEREELLRALWSRVLAEGSAVQAYVLESIVSLFDECLEPDRVFVYAQYPSDAERMLGPADVTAFNARLASDVLAALVARGHENATLAARSRMPSGTFPFGPEHLFAVRSPCAR